MSTPVPGPFCAKCGQAMTPLDSKIHPEFFLHDKCLPEELRPKPDLSPTLAVRTAEMLADLNRICDLTKGRTYPFDASTPEMQALFALPLTIQLITDLDAERVRSEALVEKYEKRLEIDHYYIARPKTERTGDVDHDLVRQEIPAEERGKYPDGVECRDATIALLEDMKEDLETDLDTAQSRAEALEGGLEPFANYANNERHHDLPDEAGISGVWNDGEGNYIRGPQLGDCRKAAELLAAHNTGRRGRGDVMQC